MSEAHNPLQELVDSVLRLATGGPGAPRRVRVRSGPASIDVEWQGRRERAAPVEDGGVAEAEPDSDVEYIRAPLIGTFYHSPSPGARPFVSEGDAVEPGQQVGIIESMKLMNAIEADRAGRVLAVLVADATAVEYDERLIALVPLGPEGP